jgi:hypothetical protein
MPRAWAMLEFVVAGGRFVTEFRYADQLTPLKGQHHRRARILEKHFPGAETDYGDANA